MTRRSTPEKFLFAGQATLLTLVAIIGFTPNSLAIVLGEKPNPPLVVHLHAAAMSAWLLLLLAQSWLVPTGRASTHRKLGLTSLWLVPTVTILMIAVAIAMFDPEQHGKGVISLQIRRVLIFAGFCAWAISVRTRDPQAHKRAWMIATVVCLDAAMFRMSFLPWFGFDSVLPAHVYQLMLLLPLFVYDFWALGHLHRVSMAGLLALTVTMVITHWVW